VKSKANLERNDIRIMVLNVPVTNVIRQMIHSLGGTHIEDFEYAYSATHIIAGDAKNSIRRTPKMMIAFSVTSKILHLDWLLNSYKQKQFQATGHYLLLRDEIAENKYSFSLRQTLQEGYERRKEGGLLKGRCIIFCEGVAGNKAPKEDELRYIVEAAGGQVISLPEISSITPALAANVIVIISDPVLPGQISGKIAKVAETGEGVFSTTWLFDSLFHQKIVGVKRGRKTQTSDEISVLTPKAIN